MDFEKIKKDVEESLNPEKFVHSQNVMDECINLAKVYNLDIEKASLIGITHDIAKEMDLDEMKKYIDKNSIRLDDIEKTIPVVWHAKVGAHICKVRYGFTSDMTKAIEEHTITGKNMSELSKILYISDAISIDRKRTDREEVKEMARENLDEALLYVINGSLKYHIENNKIIHHNALDNRNELIKKIETL